MQTPLLWRGETREKDDRERKGGQVVNSGRVAGGRALRGFDIFVPLF